jgi:hypothetical protein
MLEVVGLQILGSERQDLHRIDRQLRGCAGRRGDPGSSQFDLSLEYDRMRLFGTHRECDGSLGCQRRRGDHPRLVTKSIGRAQGKVEMNNFEARKRLLLRVRIPCGASPWRGSTAKCAKGCWMTTVFESKGVFAPKRSRSPRRLRLSPWFLKVFSTSGAAEGWVPRHQDGALRRDPQGKGPLADRRPPTPRTSR